jgi:hypothetical protein
VDSLGSAPLIGGDSIQEPSLDIDVDVPDILPVVATIHALFRESQDEKRCASPAPHSPGNDVSWPTDHRDALRLVLGEIEDRIAALWGE